MEEVRKGNAEKVKAQLDAIDDAKAELSDEEKELALKMKGILDRIDDETRIDRTTAFRAVLDKMTKEPEENWSLHYMATLLEALLYFMLNEGNEKIDEEEHNE